MWKVRECQQVKKIMKNFKINQSIKTLHFYHLKMRIIFGLEHTLCGRLNYWSQFSTPL